MTASSLVPLDGSAFSEQSVQYALGAARRSGACVHFVRVHAPVAPPDPTLPWVMDAAADAAAREQELAYLERFAGVPRACGIDVRTAVLTGLVTDALAEYVRQQSIGRIIMTTHGRGGLSRVWLGSVADSLVRMVDIPVVLLRPRTDHSRGGPAFAADHVVLPVDGSEWSERVVEHAVALGTLTGARYTLLHVMAPPLGNATEEAASDDLAEFRASASASLEVLADRLRKRGLTVQTSVAIQSQVAAGIVEYSLECGADLIAMATHSRRGWARVMLGSVADKVLRSTHVPLMLLPPDEETRLQEKLAS
jgi:nucleotide-binding universal stress UspA family protein